MEKGGGRGGRAFGVRRKPVTKRRCKGAGIARAVAEYLVSDSYMYAPLIDPPTMPPPKGSSPSSEKGVPAAHSYKGCW
ncbi:uncharacterized protein LOC109723643 [Ananas comosus]|uniref:Uncharacterized protein LOC109723643 n=1 Tax=Ananas comosus TaxID=4615 RepID=A0A6P5GNM8_ANACO|nr:uncharacterized protein LOC109723643 [Ananas comosus]